MIRNVTEFDPRSFLLVLFAFVGNGRIGGIDISLAVIAPLLVLVQLRDPWIIRRDALPKLLLVLVLLAIAAARTPAIGIAYTDTYELWPYKAILLLVLVAFGRELDWPLGNMLALSFLGLALILVGRIEDGRLVSVFGPNMLYRFFGFLLVFSIMLYLNRTDANAAATRLVLLACAGLGVTASLLTGSSGALVVILTAVFLAMLRVSKGLSVLAIGAAGYWIATSGILTGTLTAGAGAPAFYSRALYKVATIHANERFVGWIEILSQPLTIWGRDYEAFGNLWSVRYAYPHNLFVELYGFYGLVGLVLSGIVLFALFRFVPRMLRGDILSLTFVVLLLGAMLSGDLSDNYGVLGLTGGLLMRQTFRGATPSDMPQNWPSEIKTRTRKV